MDLNQATALVTGAGSGLGEGTARLLAAAGARVAVLDRAAEAAEAVAGAFGGLALAADVSDAAAMEAAFERLDREIAARGWPPLRLLVNCAGIGPSRKIVSSKEGAAPLDAFREVVEVNLIGSFNALRLAAERMTTAAPLADGERGAIVNTASIAAFEGQIGQAAYAASKAGIVGLTLPAARELSRHGVRVATVAPGVFGTPMFHTVEPEWRKTITDGVPFPKREGSPEEFARMVRFIAENPMANGTTYRLDGALRLA